MQVGVTAGAGVSEDGIPDAIGVPVTIGVRRWSTVGALGQPGFRHLGATAHHHHSPVGQSTGLTPKGQHSAVGDAAHWPQLEELARLRSHCDQFAKALTADEPIGRRLDFLLQEMNREVNTIGSKAIDLPIHDRVVEMKTVLERMREQSANVE